VTGAGISGSLSAWYLAQKGFKVTVVEQNPGVAQAASAANAGQLAYDSVYPMGSPDFLRDIPGVLFGLDSVVGIRKYLDMRIYKWGLSFMRESRYGRWIENSNALVELAGESYDLLGEIIEKTRIDFGYMPNGRLRLYDDDEALSAAIDECERRKEIWGFDYEVIGASECFRRNPLLLRRAGEIEGGILLPGDHTGDTVPLCEGLHALLSKPPYNVEYKFNAKVTGASYKEGRNIRALHTKDGQEIEGDVFLFCAGADSPDLLKWAGLKINMYPVKGCSMIFPRKDMAELLENNITDTVRRLVIAPMRDGIKISTGMLFAGNDARHDKKLVHYMHIAGREVIPGLDFSNVEIHTGLRPAMPSSQPVVRRAEGRNIYLNTGHGMWGWLLAPATASRAAGLIAENAS
jgi:D-amino-acid dehydrogenase